MAVCRRYTCLNTLSVYPSPSSAAPGAHQIHYAPCQVCRPAARRRYLRATRAGAMERFLCTRVFSVIRPVRLVTSQDQTCCNRLLIAGWEDDASECGCGDLRWVYRRRRQLKSLWSSHMKSVPGKLQAK